MTKKERDRLDLIGEVIARIDERQKQLTERDLPEIKEHLKETKISLLKHSEHLAILNTTIYGKNGDPGLVHLVENQGKRLARLIIIVALISGSLGYGIPQVIKLFI